MYDGRSKKYDKTKSGVLRLLFLKKMLFVRNTFYIFAA